jgi:hypothetical protein
VKTGVRVTSSVRPHSARPRLSIDPNAVANAFDTTTSTRPVSRAVSATSRVICASSATSTHWKRPPASFATRGPRSRSTSATTTRAPSRASAATVAAPMPDAPPVTIATRPANRPSMCRA